ncbi:MAG: PD40 domain-containing protein, partial [Pirellulales bacterium]|nr:PD40 domain-containing protein [Pirellulales bacterium]
MASLVTRCLIINMACLSVWNWGLAGLAAESNRLLLENTLLSAHPIVFVVRQQYKHDHHNTATMFQTGEINTGSFAGGGAIKTIDVSQDGKVKTLLSLPNGVARDLEVGFDGKKILFSMRRDINDDYHIYEMNADGTDLRQLTHGSGLSDIDPIYMPDGKIIFSSTREPKYCMCNRHIMCNLFTMNADGSNMQQIGHSTLHEG